SDLFSFGVVLFELTTGRLPFEGETREALLSKIVNLPAPALSAFRADVPPQLEHIVAKLMMKQPSARYQHADEALLDLRSLHASLHDDTKTSPAGRWARSKLTRRRYTVSALLAVLGVLAAALYFYAYRSPPPSGTTGVRSEETLAVLPFDYVGNSPSDEAFTSGLFEILANKLSQLAAGRLKVISANDVLKQKVHSAMEAQKSLGAQLILTGKLQPSVVGFSFSLALIDAAKQATLESREIQASREELTMLPDKLVEQAVQMLKLRGTAQEPGLRAGSGLTHVPEALALYLRGRGYLQRYDRSENIEKAIDAFDRALALHPSFALAHAARAEAYLRRYQSTRDTSFLTQARMSCQRAIELNPQLFEVHLIMGLIHSTAGEYQDAIISFESALKVQPENADAWRELANTYVAAGRLDEAEGTFKRLIRLRPDDWSAFKDLGVFYNNLGR